MQINKDQTLKIELPTVKHCKRVENLYLCPNNFPIIKSTDLSCLSQIFLGNKERKACKNSISKLPKAEQFPRFPSGWYYLTPFDISVTVVCPNKEIKHLTLLKGRGEVVCPLNCQISTKNHLIAATTDF